MRRQIFLLLIAVALLAGCVPLEERTAHFENKWPAANIKRLEVSEVNGIVSVAGDSPNEITMVANVRARGYRPNPREQYEGYLRTELEGDVLAISTRRQHGFQFGYRELRVDYEIHVPPQVALNLGTVNGRITTRGIAGETAAKTVNGAVDIEATGSNEVSARSVNGRIQAKFLDDFHGAQLGTVNGRVTCVLPATASFLGDFTQVNGDFEAAFPLNIHSHPGSRRVSGEVNGGKYPLKITTVNGDINIDNGPSRPEPPAPPAPPAAAPRM
jgi:putative adhesin